jgi:hypothetical protein
MYRSKLKLWCAFLLVTLLALSCASAKYIGQSYPPTTEVDVYYSEKEVKQAYTTIGQASGRSGFGSDDSAVAKLIEKAKSVGADAIIIKGIEEEKNPDDIVGEETRITASFLKYKQQN